MKATQSKNIGTGNAGGQTCVLGRAMSRFVKLFVLLVSLIVMGTWGGEAMARACTSAVVTGNWSATGTWSCVGGNRVPTSNDSVTIAVGHTITVDVSTASVQSVTVNGNLVQSSTLNDAGPLAVAGTLTSSNTMTIGGATTVTGALNITSTTGSRTFTGAVIVSGGTWNNSAGEAVTFSGGITNNGTFTAGTGTQTFNTNSQAIDGASPINFGGIVAVSGAVTITNNNTNVVTIGGNLTGSNTSSTWVNGTNSTLNYGGATGPMGTRVFTASASGNTVNYIGAGQAVDATTYYNLTLSGSGTKTMPATATATHDFIISNGAAVTAGAALTVGGNWTELGSFAQGAGTVTLNGLSAQTISGINPVTFNKLTVSAANPNITLTTNVTVATLTGTVNLTPSCPDFTLTSNSPAQTLHSCPPSPPTVTSIVPASGPTAGGTAVTITGTNFTGATAVTIGGASATSIVVSNATTITAVTPAGTAGARDVVVTTPGGTGTGTGLFTYVAAPIVTSISPNTGPTAGGTSVTITGNNFTGATAVTIGGASATSIAVSNATTITAVAPAGTAGAQNVVVTTPYGTGTGTGLFTYLAAPIAEYRMDEASWNGTANEVIDSGTGGFPGAAAGLTTRPTTSIASPAISGSPGTCRYGVFNRSNKDYIALPVGFPNLAAAAGEFTITAWINVADNTLPGQRIFIDDQNNTSPGGWGFSVGETTALGAGGLRFYYRQPSVYTLDTVAIPSNQWLFVALSVQLAAGANASTATIYAWDTTGTLKTSITGTFTWTAGSDPGPSSIGGETNASGEGTNAFGFGGNIDEVRVYQKVLSQAALAAIATQTHTCAVAGPDHIRVQHDGNGLTCTPETLTVIACADVSCTTLYTASAVTGNVTWAGTTGGSVAFNITAGGSTTVSLPVTTPQTVTLGTSAVLPAPINASDCVNTATATASCSLPFADSALLVSAPNHVAETAQSMTISAVRKDNKSLVCVPAFKSVSRTINLKCAYANPIAGTLPVRVAGVALNAGNNAVLACDATGQSPTLTFDASGTATTTLKYADVGQMTLNATYTGSAGTGDAGLVMTDSGSFIAAPASFAFSGITTGLIKAGNPFSATVTARNALDSTTPNFGKETTPESVTLSSTLVTPNPVTYPAASNPTPGNNVIAGTEFGPGGMVNDANGVAGINNLSWGEVGNITLTPALTSGSYLASGLTATGTSASVGAFIPDHFDTAVVATATVPMPCPTNPTVLICPTLYNGFVYSGQPFSEQVTARNLASGTTTNYDGTFGLSKAVTLTAWDALGSATTQNPGGGAVANGSVLAAAFGSTCPKLPSGFEMGCALASVPTYTLPTSTTAPTNIFIRASDGEASSLRLINPTTTSIEGGVAVVSGRVKISNAYGSEQLPLPMTATVQYYNAAGGWVTSTTDKTTPFNTATNIGAAIVTGPLAVANISVVNAGAVTVDGGVRPFTLNKSGVTGSADISLNAPNYLLAGSNGGGVNPSIAGRATFGVYQGRKEFIYMRENY